jgi:hypothetical protein
VKDAGFGGSWAYMDPVYMKTRKCSPQSDLYAFSKHH